MVAHTEAKETPFWPSLTKMSADILGPLGVNRYGNMT